MDGYMVIVVAQPGECCAQEVLYVSHEVDLDMLGQFFYKLLFFFRVCGVEYEVIHIHAHVYLLMWGWDWWQGSLKGGCRGGGTLYHHPRV